MKEKGENTTPLLKTRFSSGVCRRRVGWGWPLKIVQSLEKWNGDNRTRSGAVIFIYKWKDTNAAEKMNELWERDLREMRELGERGNGSEDGGGVHTVELPHTVDFWRDWEERSESETCCGIFQQKKSLSYH